MTTECAGRTIRERATTDIEVVALLHCYGIDIVDFKAIGSGRERWRRRRRSATRWR